MWSKRKIISWKFSIYLPFWPTGFFIYRPNKINKKKKLRRIKRKRESSVKIRDRARARFRLDTRLMWVRHGPNRWYADSVSDKRSDWLITHRRPTSTPHIYVFLPFFNDNFAFLANPSYFSQLEIKMIYIYICNDSHSSFLFLDSTIICVI